MFLIPCGLIKMGWTKFFHPTAFHCTAICIISLFSEITISHGGKLFVSRGFKMRNGAKLRVRQNGKGSIQNNVSVGSNCIIICHDKITIGANTQLAPNVQICEHNHNFRTGDLPL